MSSSARVVSCHLSTQSFFPQKPARVRRRVLHRRSRALQRFVFHICIIVLVRLNLRNCTLNIANFAWYFSWSGYRTRRNGCDISYIASQEHPYISRAYSELDHCSMGPIHMRTFSKPHTLSTTSSSASLAMVLLEKALLLPILLFPSATPNIDPGRVVPPESLL